MNAKPALSCAIRTTSLPNLRSIWTMTPRRPCGSVSSGACRHLSHRGAVHGTDTAGPDQNQEGLGIGCWHGSVAAALRGLTTVGIQAAHATMIGITRVEVCKGGPLSNGTFLFSVNGSTTPISVAVDTCKGVAVKPGSNTVRELADTSGLTRLGKIQITPATAGVSNLATRSATVFVPRGGEVIARFVNEPTTSLLKVCAVAADPALLGDTFSFTESANGTTIGPTSVIAGTTNPLNCTSVTTYPTGTAVNVAQLPIPGFGGVSNVLVTGGVLNNINLSAGTVTADGDLDTHSGDLHRRSLCGRLRAPGLHRGLCERR